MKRRAARSFSDAHVGTGIEQWDGVLGLPLGPNDPRRGEINRLLSEWCFRTELGDFVHRLRLALNLSQGQLAKRLGCEQVRLSHIERGHLLPSESDLFELSRLIIDRLRGAGGPR